MSLFSSQPKNRRTRRHNRSKASTEWIDETASSSSHRGKKVKKDSPANDAHKLHAQIGAIETFLATHHQAEAQKMQMKRENILPPPDRSAHRKARKKMTKAARRRYLAERNRTSFRFFLLFCTACGLVWWLLFPGA